MVRATTLRPQERVLLLARFDWDAYFAAGGDASALRGLYSSLLADPTLAQQVLLPMYHDMIVCALLSRSLLLWGGC